MNAPPDRQPSEECDLKLLLELVEAEEKEIVRALEIALDEKTLTRAAARARLAPGREDHWMNRQGDRRRQAIDRKMKFTPVLLKALGVAQAPRLKARSRARCRNQPSGRRFISKQVDSVSYRMRGDGLLAPPQNPFRMNNIPARRQSDVSQKITASRLES